MPLVNPCCNLLDIEIRSFFPGIHQAGVSLRQQNLCLQFLSSCTCTVIMRTFCGHVGGLVQSLYICVCVCVFCRKRPGCAGGEAQKYFCSYIHQ